MKTQILAAMLFAVNACSEMPTGPGSSSGEATDSPPVDGPGAQSDSEIADYMAALGRLLASAKRAMGPDEWSEFLQEIGISEGDADVVMGLAADRAKVDISLASHLPVVDLDTAALVEKRILSGVRHVGSDVAPLPAGTTCDRSGRLDQHGQPAPVPSARWCASPLPDHSLRTVVQHGTVWVSHGRIRDGVGRKQVVAWLRQNAVAAQEWVPGLLPGLPIHTRPLTVRMHDGTTDIQAGYVIEAVRIINAALPSEWKLTVAEDTTPVVAVSEVPAGEVHVGFTMSLLTEYDTGRFNLTINDGDFTGGRVLIRSDLAPYGARSAIAVATEFDYRQTNVGLLVHEIMHGMGFLAHPDMASATSYDRDLTGWAGLPAHVLYPLDREGMLAAYTRLEPGVAPEDIDDELGPWSDTSVHVRGVLGLPDGEEIAFGAARRNGFAQPWAYGPEPSRHLEDNTSLRGTARWEGRLLGLTPRAEVVAGAANMAVRLIDLTGTLDFTGLEAWAPSAAPGAIGTGRRWLDGDLGYTIIVEGNVFVQTGGDVGVITGAFFGAAHDGMGGTLERTDMAGAFGGFATERHGSRTNLPTSERRPSSERSASVPR